MSDSACVNDIDCHDSEYLQLLVYARSSIDVRIAGAPVAVLDESVYLCRLRIRIAPRSRKRRAQAGGSSIHAIATGVKSSSLKACLREAI